MARDWVVVGIEGRLPVDGLHAVFKLSRRPELPLADDRPDQHCTTNAGRDDDNHSQSRLCDRGCGRSAVGISGRCGLGLRRRRASDGEGNVLIRDDSGANVCLRRLLTGC